jgi:hypothetical protein
VKTKRRHFLRILLPGIIGLWLTALGLLLCCRPVTL